METLTQEAAESDGEVPGGGKVDEDDGRQDLGLKASVMSLM